MDPVNDPVTVLRMAFQIENDISPPGEMLEGGDRIMVEVMDSAGNTRAEEVMVSHWMTVPEGMARSMLHEPSPHLEILICLDRHSCGGYPC